MNPKIRKIILSNVPYLFVALFATKLGLAWRLAEGADASAKLLNLLDTLAAAFSSPAPSFHPFDLCVGIIVAGILRGIVYIKNTVKTIVEKHVATDSIVKTRSTVRPAGERPKTSRPISTRCSPKMFS